MRGGRKTKTFLKTSYRQILGGGKICLIVLNRYQKSKFSKIPYHPTSQG
jgi:hypothetical protein